MARRRREADAHERLRIAASISANAARDDAPVAW